MGCGSVRARMATRTEGSADGESRRRGLPGAALALAGRFGRAARSWWLGCAESACAGLRRPPRVRGGAQHEGRPGRYRASAEGERRGLGLRIASARRDHGSARRGERFLPPAPDAPFAPGRTCHPQTLTRRQGQAPRAGARRARAPRSPGRLRGGLRRAAAAGLLACAAALALPALPGPGGVAHADVLVSNLGQAGSGFPANVVSNSPSAQAFTTGSNIAGYALDSVELTLEAKPDDTTVFVVSIHEANGSEPGAVRYHDLLPSADIAAGNNTFNAPADAFLARDTTYFVMVEYNHPTNQSAAANPFTTNSNSEDAAGDDDWSIANNFVYRHSGGWITTARTDSLQIRIEGSALDGPDITGISVPSSPAQGDTYGRGETIEFAVRFDEAVEYEGSDLHARLYLDDTPPFRRADYVEGSGTRTLTFGYTVQEGDVDADGVAFVANGLAHNATPSEGPRGGGTITSVATGRDADLTNSSQRWSTARIDGSQLNLAPPEITHIEVASEVPDRGFYLHTAGDTMEFRVTFSEPVIVSGEGVHLTVWIGGGAFQVPYAGGTGTRELSFATAVAEQNTDTDGVSVRAGSLTLIGATTLKGPCGRFAMRAGSRPTARRRSPGAAWKPRWATASPCSAGGRWRRRTRAGRGRGRARRCASGSVSSSAPRSGASGASSARRSAPGARATGTGLGRRSS